MAARLFAKGATNQALTSAGKAKTLSGGEGRYARGGLALVDESMVARADRAARVWHGASEEPIVVGGEAHKRLFCRMLLDTHNPYKPTVLDWPKLAPAEQARLVTLPIWDMAVATEGHASIRVMTYASRVADPLLKEAVILNGFEEGRHKQVLGNMVAAYGIALAPEQAYPVPKDAEWAFMVTGYSECLDSFFAFGLFDLAKRSGFFPQGLVDTFEPVMQEECRHILFFVNWVAWHRRNIGPLARLWFDLRRFGVFMRLVTERIQTARAVGGGDNFTMTGHESMGIEADLGGLLRSCLAENERRMAGYDARLLRPATVPRLARLMLWLPFFKAPAAA
jgi:hypothetical protein